MQLETLLDQIKHAASEVTFSDVIAVVDEHYSYQQCEFSNGKGADTVMNAAGTNVGSCKIFAFGLLNQLSEAETLACFGDFYRSDVLQNPDGNDHQNIRSFMKTGWAGIHFSGQALTPNK